MSFDKEIEAPFTLASLPRPLQSTDGQTQASGVCSLSGVRKRKRTEIAVGVDGEGVLIYSLQNPQLVTSYALPPWTSFTTPPFSIYRKGSSKQPSCRFTYASVSPCSPVESHQLICFTEEVHLMKENIADTTKTSYTIPKSTSKVVAIDLIPISAGTQDKKVSHDVLVVFDDGHVTSLSSDLKSQRWHTDLNTLAASGTQANVRGLLKVEHVTVTMAKKVLRGLLRSRGDIAATLGPPMGAKSEILELIQVLCVVSKRRDGQSNDGISTTLDLYQISPRSPDLFTSHMLPVKHLVTWELPSPSSNDINGASKSVYSLHSATGILHQLTNGVLFSYDFSETVPKRYAQLKIPGLGSTSFIRIFPDLVFTTSQNFCGIFDVKYNSIQALVPLKQRLTASPGSKKRKHAEPESVCETEAGPTLITYFADIELAVGILNHELIGIQLAGTLARKKFRADGTLLINSIGKGIHLSRNGQQWQDWQRKVHKLDKYASKGKVSEFEELFARELDVDFTDADTTNPDMPQIKLENGAERSLLTNGVNEDTPDDLSEAAIAERPGESSGTELRKWKLPKVITDSHRHRHRQHAVYALSKIFQWEDPGSRTRKEANHSSLQVRFFPPNVFQWLLLSGYLTKESIRRSLLELSPDASGSIPSTSDGDIVNSIVRFDPELHILSAILNHSNYLPVGEVVQAINISMQNLDDRPQADAEAKLSASGTTLPEVEMNVDFASELEAATHDLDHALSILNNGLFIRSHTLRPALIRLHTFPASIITSTLRSILPRRELESLVRLLLSELKNGGWSSTYDFIDPDSLPAESLSEEPDDHAIAIIASLLSCTLDAIGPSAWLAAREKPSDESTEEMINDLHEETTLALNGFWEARFMRGLLGEFLRYAANIAKSQKPTNTLLQKQGKPFETDIATDGTLPMLPLGGKVDLGVEKTKPGKGGKKEERSAREIGMLISKKVPKYSFERIVI
ncbi:uncharacterized protein BDR25DRAFT_294162 [Lindgomyces ingoldianus]|uniref:Uncharacterized protein n=1 Tax=Lindgomyces ingoldianus TaxID=673940 RepID=A0ACB6QGF4_9PLEO|nr:uncharacterized protein BDR25DRAFT_294162 [Lindgomyces ingoldianus]KAF2466094.1 hypothetical protein BDR25DRAFT_294162 [Lindgomyces ingoldianus]